MNININYEDPSFQHDEYEKVIDRVCEEAALVYGLGPNAEISILLCHNDYIHQLNKQYRNIDRPTDVLSFALNEREDDGYDGPDTALLGDIIISLEKVQEQADEYGHSFERELAYLTIHGMLHILGYDHMEPDDKAEMRKEEEFILLDENITKSKIIGVIYIYYYDKNDSIVLVDFKTDKITQESSFISKYKKQLEIYKIALEKLLNKPVNQVYIYSFYLNKKIKVEC